MQRDGETALDISIRILIFSCLFAAAIGRDAVPITPKLSWKHLISAAGARAHSIRPRLTKTDDPVSDSDRIGPGHARARAMLHLHARTHGHAADGEG